MQLNAHWVLHDNPVFKNVKKLCEHSVQKGKSANTIEFLLMGKKIQLLETGIGC